MLDAASPLVREVTNGAALDTLWREFDRHNGLGHTSVSVPAGNRHRKLPCILNFRIDASGRAVLDLQKAQRRPAQWWPAPPSWSGDAIGSISLPHRVALPSQVHRLLHSADIAGPRSPPLKDSIRQSPYCSTKSLSAIQVLRSSLLA